ncbi:MAG: cell filamentation protein Fic [Nanoarchaeota archaeon]|nr:cell filamentation protein Fic [Nanoarchaeota archaeon]|tara:strand:+ start:4828 stop:5778 length:951 start_codon:yes stop_codon:yes gene_type:complete
MHIEKRKVKAKTKYYLAHSYREGNKVHKFRKYLGQNIKKLKERKNIAEKLILEEIHKYKIIKDPLHFELSEKEIKAISDLEKEIPLNIHHFSEQQWTVFSEIFTYNTNAIEGSRLNQREVQKILEEDKWPDKSKEDIAETYGVDDAIQFIRETHEHISIDIIKEIHKIVFKNSKSFAGKLRKAGEEVVVMDNQGHVVHEGAPQPRVNHLLKELVKWYEKNKKKYPGLILAAVVHNQFENIHPFRDGNGRVGRILMNNILIKHNLPPLNIDFTNRMEYYKSLQAYEKKKDLQPTITLFMKEYNELQKKLGDYKNHEM